MSIKNKVLWSEGMFLQAQHFQQQDRFFLGQIQALSAMCLPHAWGFSELEFDAELLRVGKLSIKKASGTFSDGTVFSMPDVDSLPDTLDIGDMDTGETQLVLCLPVQRDGTTEVANESEPYLRYQKILSTLRDSASNKGQEADIEIVKLNCQLRPMSEDLSGFSVLPVAKVKRISSDSPIELSSTFLPPLLHCGASSHLMSNIEEIVGLIKYRADALAGRLLSNDRGNSSAVQDFMYLQLLNRIGPLLEHFSHSHYTHPYTVFLSLIQSIGELASFSEARLRPPPMPPYRQDALSTVFEQTFALFRQYLSVVPEQTAMMLHLTERKYGIYVAPLEDRSQLDTCIFVLSVKGKVDRQQLKRSLPSLTRIAPVEKIRDIISSRTSGINIWPTESEPRQIPYSAGAVYFELDRKGEFWGLMKKSGGFAVHIDMDIPELQMELWAIRTE
ncbi:type VI secretion system baseplate subunit TssK [Marinobacter sp. chi1]|uniref:Type VI secretion system baseplate subunit TssK n=1 Tax=Marinobacter suaedae TaxID=3057675 RepID=A0ABT8VW03_9GAMM|nr:type VI secretion system baseplate subunit TssK [Marinobacter sp. chi1]MDO3720172.1 type VI secretion system baseplate subunit TssK [Marinobacter sp. chi1]